MANPEKQIENLLVKDFEKHDCYIRKYPADQHTNKGVPDRLACVNGYFVGLEIKKRNGGKPTPVQIRNLVEIAANGGVALVTSNTFVLKDIKMMLERHEISHYVDVVEDEELLFKACHNANTAAKLWHDSKVHCHSDIRSLLISQRLALNVKKRLGLRGNKRYEIN